MFEKIKELCANKTDFTCTCDDSCFVVQFQDTVVFKIIDIVTGDFDNQKVESFGAPYGRLVEAPKGFSLKINDNHHLVPLEREMVTYFISSGQGKKYDQGKIRFDLLPHNQIKQIAEILTFGCNKYGPNNWQKVESWRYIGAAMRHFNDFQSGDIIDKESGKHVLAHMLCDIMFLLWQSDNDCLTMDDPGEVEDGKV
jgi:hypothetical protein